MKRIIFILFVLMSFCAVNAQTTYPTTLPSPKADSGFNQTGYIRPLILGHIVMGDTMIRPKYNGATRLWAHAGVDTAYWSWINTRWVKISSSGSGGTGGSGITSLGQGWGVTIINDSTYSVDSLAVVSWTRFYNSLDSLVTILSALNNLTFTYVGVGNASNKLSGSAALTYTTGSGLTAHTITNGTGGTDSVLVESNGTIKKISPTYYGTGVGSGTVTSFSSGNLSPLFTTSVATATTTPALSFALSNATAWQVFRRGTGTTGAPSYGGLVAEHLNTTYSNGNMLITDGSGNLSWTTAGTGNISGTLNDSRVVFSANGDVKDTVNFVYKRSNGYVGIGVASPLSPLHVQQNSNTPGVTMYFQNINSGTTAQTSIAAINDIGAYGAVSSFSSNHTYTHLANNGTVSAKNNLYIIGNGDGTTGGTTTLHMMPGGFFQSEERFRMDRHGSVFSDVAISALADASSVFELISTERGFLAPRMTAAQRTSISSAATGLLVFDSDSGRYMLKTASSWRGIAFTGEAGSGGITALTGDVTASGSGSVAATLAAVNSNVGSFTNANITVNAKGLITAASNGNAGTVTSIATTSPITGGTITTTGTIGINNAAADGSTKGAASFTANDFDATSGNISIDYTNGQKATASVPGFLTAADWTNFNNKLSSDSIVFRRYGNPNPQNFKSWNGGPTDAGAQSVGAANTTTSNDSTNMSIGYLSMNDGTTGYRNIFMGIKAGNKNTTGFNNVGIGYSSLGGASAAAQTGNSNVAVGGGLQKNQSGSTNVAIGAGTTPPLNTNTTGSNNVAIGSAALSTSVSVGSNVGIGTNALAATTTGFNTAVGTNAGQGLAGGALTAFGYTSGNIVTSGSGTALGSGALAGSAGGGAQTITGASNLAVGTNALRMNNANNSTGTAAHARNTVLGEQAAPVGYASAIADNVFVGYGAGNYSNAGAGTAITGNRNIAIGAQATILSLSGSDQFVLGSGNNTTTRWMISDLGGGSSTRRWVMSGGTADLTATTPSAALDIQSTTGGFKPPCMTTTQKNAISSPAEGLIVYDLTLHKLCVYTGSAWETITSL